MTTSEKVAYLKGLCEGMGIGEDSKEGKLFSVIMDILEDMALEIEDLYDEQADLEEGLDAVSEDLSDVESFIYEMDDEDDEEYEFDEDSEIYETTCPNCEEEILFDETILEDGYVKCPNCGEKLEFELTECEDDCDCCECDGECEDKE